MYTIPDIIQHSSLYDTHLPWINFSDYSAKLKDQIDKNIQNNLKCLWVFDVTIFD